MNRGTIEGLSGHRRTAPCTVRLSVSIGRHHLLGSCGDPEPDYLSALAYHFPDDASGSGDATATQNISARDARINLLPIKAPLDAMPSACSCTDSIATGDDEWGIGAHCRLHGASPPHDDVNRTTRTIGLEKRMGRVFTVSPVRRRGAVWVGCVCGARRERASITLAVYRRLRSSLTV